jgi:branched-chain amino acid transport system permease protein
MADIAAMPKPCTTRTSWWARVGPELAIIAIGIAAALLFPDDLGFITRINILAIFTLSLSLVIGQAGIGTLGQAAMFGAGSYVAALWTIHVSSEPLSGLLLAALAGTVVAFLGGLLLLRTRGLTLIMLSVAFAQVLFEIANKAASITGGDDGLADIHIDPLLGLFAFDMRGHVGFAYTLAILVATYFCLRRLVASPFGLTCRGIRADQLRMRALGTPVFAHLLAVYALGGAIAGIAGGLSAQTTQVVGLNSLGFELSAEGLVMLTIGGVRQLAGALIGVPVYMTIQHVAAAINPYHWLFAIGALLIVTVLYLPDGLYGLFERCCAAVERRLR